MKHIKPYERIILELCRKVGREQFVVDDVMAQGATQSRDSVAHILSGLTKYGLLKRIVPGLYGLTPDSWLDTYACEEVKPVGFYAPRDRVKDKPVHPLVEEARSARLDVVQRGERFVVGGMVYATEEDLERVLTRPRRAYHERIRHALPSQIPEPSERQRMGRR